MLYTLLWHVIIMKHLLTLIQIIYWLLIDFALLLFHLKWNMYLNKCGYSFKKKNGIVMYASNYDKKYMKTIDDIYQAAFFL